MRATLDGMTNPTVDAAVAALRFECPTFKCRMRPEVCVARQLRGFRFGSGHGSLDGDPCAAWASSDPWARPCLTGLARLADAGAAGWSWMPCACVHEATRCDGCDEGRVPVSTEFREQLAADGLSEVPAFRQPPLDDEDEDD